MYCDAGMTGLTSVLAGSSAIGSGACGSVHCQMRDGWDAVRLSRKLLKSGWLRVTISEPRRSVLCDEYSPCHHTPHLSWASSVSESELDDSDS